MNFLLVFFIIIAVLILLFQLYPLLSSFRIRGKRITSLSGVVADSVQEQSRFLLYFWAPQCGMCRSMTPVVNSLLNQRDDLAKIDASQYPDMARALGVLGTPALVVVEEGVIVKVSLGAKSEKSILRMLG